MVATLLHFFVMTSPLAVAHDWYLGRKTPPWLAPLPSHIYSLPTLTNIGIWAPISVAVPSQSVSCSVRCRGTPSVQRASLWSPSGSPKVSAASAGAVARADTASHNHCHLLPGSAGPSERRGGCQSKWVSGGGTFAYIVRDPRFDTHEATHLPLILYSVRYPR